LYTIVLLTEKALTTSDVQRVAHLHDPEQVKVYVVVPVDTKHRRFVEALDDVAYGNIREAVDPDFAPADKAQAIAQQALDAAIAALTAEGVEVHGELGPDNPVDKVVEVAAQVDADEVMVVTEPHLLEEGLRRDWASRIRDRAKRPVLHFVAGTDRVVS
jgi:hypothetical protein